MLYNTEFSILVKPHGATAPHIRYGINNNINEQYLDKPRLLEYSLDLSAGPQNFFIEFDNKTNDTSDMAVEIVAVTFEGLTLDRFRWANRYWPCYPEPWASEQTEPLPEFHSHATYLGWNGRWVLEFETPIFQWIHRLENLGWVYP